MRYFQTAAKLTRFAWYDYSLVSLVLFQTIAGFEGALRARSNDRTTPFKTLIHQAVEARLISRRAFSNIEILPDHLANRIEKGATTYVAKLMSVIRSLRNWYFHGEHVLFPECLHLAIQMREAADALLIPRSVARPQ